MTHEERSPRRVLLDTVKSLFKALRNQDYYVKRGVINWTAHDFVQRPLAVSIQMDELSAIPKGIGQSECKLTFELFTMIPDAPRTKNVEIDDRALDNMIDDVQLVINSLITAKNAQGDPVVFLIRDTGRIVEAHDVTLKVQGCVVMLDVIF